MNIGKTISTLRKQKQLSQGDLAIAIGVTKATISNYERNFRKPDYETLKKIASVLDCNILDLMGEEPQSTTINVLTKTTLHRVPLLGAVGAGIPKAAYEEYDEFIETYTDADYALMVDGDSMSPTILRGDVALIRVQPDVDDGQIAAVLMDDSAVIKRITHIPNGLILISDNQAYPPRMVTASEFDTIKILGKVFRIERNI